MRDEIRSYLHHLSAERHASPHTLRNYESDLEELRDFLAAGRRRRPLAIRRVSRLKGVHRGLDTVLDW